MLPILKPRITRAPVIVMKVWHKKRFLIPKDLIEVTHLDALLKFIASMTQCVPRKNILTARQSTPNIYYDKSNDLPLHYLTWGSQRLCREYPRGTKLAGKMVKDFCLIFKFKPYLIGQIMILRKKAGIVISGKLWSIYDWKM